MTPPAPAAAVGTRLLATLANGLKSRPDSNPLTTNRKLGRGASTPSLTVNVGCAEGYYTVGLAMRLPQAIVYAFEADPKARRATIRHASLNGVAERVRMAGPVHAKGLERLLQLGRALVIMDSEGAEWELLDPQLMPAAWGNLLQHF